MTDDAPLASFIGRSIRAVVSDVSAETIQDTTSCRLERISFTQDGLRRSLVVKRVPPAEALEVRLLPHLARKSDRVPTVFARGIPPVATSAWPWLLLEDLHDAPPARDDLAGVVRAKAAVERAVRSDAPALTALGVTRSGRPGVLAEWPEVLVHGGLVCAAAVHTGRGIVLTGWQDASLGSGLLDVVRLARDAAITPEALADVYAAETGWGPIDWASRAGQMVAAAQAVEESPGSTGQDGG